MTLTEREQLVLSLLNHVTPLVRKLARDWHLEYDDLYQDVSVHLMKLVDRPFDHIRNLPAVAAYSTRQIIINKWHYTDRREACSLDKPLIPDSETTIADLLPSPYNTDPEFVLLVKERLENLKATVERLPGRHGVAMRERYETALATYC